MWAEVAGKQADFPLDGGRGNAGPLHNILRNQSAPERRGTLPATSSGGSVVVLVIEDDLRLNRLD